MLKKYITFNLIIIVLYCVICNFIFTTETSNKLSKKITNTTQISEQVANTSDIIATLTIPSLNINKNIYKISSSENNVDKNVTILTGSSLPDKNNSIVFLAAHSGSGKNAYFDNLKTININDKVYFKYNNKTYIYKVIKINEIEKNGYISGTRYNNKELVLTTCSENPKKQLVVNCVIEKENLAETK